MIAIYLDQCMVNHHLARQLREAGRLVYLPGERGVSEQDDALQLTTASSLSAVLVTQNQKDFVPLHRQWQLDQREHAGIILVPGGTVLAVKIDRLERAGRLLTSEVARNQLMYLG